MNTLGELLLYASALLCAGAWLGAVTAAVRAVWRVRHKRTVPAWRVERMR